MGHLYFKQPNGKYSIWSTIVDAPLDQDLSKTELQKLEQLTDLDFSFYVHEKMEDVIDEGTIEVCLGSESMTKQELISYLKSIGYDGHLIEYIHRFADESSIVTPKDAIRYFGDLRLITHPGERQAVELAIYALSKQVPRKPKVEVNLNKDKEIFKCHKCGCILELEKNFFYCPECGQKIGWEMLRRENESDKN